MVGLSNIQFLIRVCSFLATYCVRWFSATFPSSDFRLVEKHFGFFINHEIISRFHISHRGFVRAAYRVSRSHRAGFHFISVLLWCYVGMTKTALRFFAQCRWRKKNEDKHRRTEECQALRSFDGAGCCPRLFWIIMKVWTIKLANIANLCGLLIIRSRDCNFKRQRDLENVAWQAKSDADIPCEVTKLSSGHVDRRVLPILTKNWKNGRWGETVRKPAARKFWCFLVDRKTARHGCQ